MPEREDRPTPGPAWRAAEAHGIDMSLIESNLLWSPAERLRVHSLANAMALALRQAMTQRAAAPGTLVERLIRNGVGFAVVGDFAGFAYGATSLGVRLDVCCAFSYGDLMRLQAALADLHPVHRRDPGRASLSLTRGNWESFKELCLDTEGGPLDCLSEVAGVGDFDEVKRNSIEVELAAGPCRILSLDALIQSKEVLNEPRDREALLQLKAIRERLERG